MGRPLAVVGVSLLAALAGATASSGCSQAPVDTPLRSLESSGPVSFLCLGDPALGQENAPQPLSACSQTRTDGQDDYSIPHLYALVTQPNSGQVAVVDLTTNTNPRVVDANESVPGSNFLPVGAIPTSIVSTPGGTATFVAAAEPSFERIYALPSDMVRGTSPTLTSWPSCALPAAPGEMQLIMDPATEEGAIRPSCDSDYGDDEIDAGCEDEEHCHGDLEADASRAGTPGRPKLVVALPSEGGIAVIDAQDLLDRESGTADPCVVERWLPLQVQLPPPPEPPPAPSDAACVPVPFFGENPDAANLEPMPGGLAEGGGRLYVADENAPVIHRLEMSDPCDPHELPPLATSSVEDPLRVVVTSDIAVSPLTLDLKRYLYAIDRFDGSIMAYDVSDEGGSTQPLQRENAVFNPFQPRDRIRFGAPPRELLLLRHQFDEADDVTGATIPIRCDASANASSDAASYRTSSDYSTGAGPTRLRGVFGFAVLGSGDIVVIDIDDFDADCRGPRDEELLFGCGEPLASGLGASGEYTCNVIAPHEPRAATYLINESGVSDNQPGITSFPVLFNSEGTVVQEQVFEDDPEGTIVTPVMKATIPEESLGEDNVLYNLVVGSDIRLLDASTGQLRSDQADDFEHVLVMNQIDPRAHILDQAWTVTYEGALPGFTNRFAELVEEEGGFRLNEVSSAFCTRGVVSQGAVRDDVLASGGTEGEADETAAAFADYVQIFGDFPVEADPYWSAQNECTFNACNATYGTTDAPREARDYRIVEAFEDSLQLEPRVEATGPRLKCCFPGVAEFRVRAGRQWVVVGDAVGFLHNMTIADNGTCRRSCDSDLLLLNGRAFERTPGEPVEDTSGRGFANPFFRFAITSALSERDMQFSFTTKGRFDPLTISVVTNDEDVQPAAATFLPVGGQIVVSDGSLDGITLIDLDDLAVADQVN